MQTKLALLVVDAALRISFANDYVAATVATEARALRGRRLALCFPPDDAVMLNRLADVIGTDRVLYYATSIERQDASVLRITFRVHGIAVAGDGGQAALVLVAAAAEAQSPVRDGHGTDERERFRNTYAHTSLTYADAAVLYDRLEATMASELLYLNKALDLDAACKRLQTNQLYLSQVVNFFAGENFRDYLNGKRIEHIIDNAAQFRELAIGEMWRVAGFGSYSAFRRFLQSNRDMTPGQFVRTIRSPVRLEAMA